MTQKQLGDALGMAQTWVSKLENPDYGKMTVATLLRLAEAFDADLEIKFRPFSSTIDTLPEQGPGYFSVPSFAEEHGEIETKLAREEKLAALVGISRVLWGLSGTPDDNQNIVDRTKTVRITNEASLDQVPRNNLLVFPLPPQNKPMDKVQWNSVRAKRA